MKKASFRFYEELNEYLPEGKRKVWFGQEFGEGVPLKSIIQAMGVPLSEIDLVLVRQESKSLDYIPLDGDKISVYPVFEMFDISSIGKVREKPLRNPKFICDVHLGKLAKYLRMLGFDTFYSNNATNSLLIDVSLQEERIILSRAYRLIKHHKVARSFWIRAFEPLEQIKDIANKLDLYSLINPLTLCLDCNTPLAQIDKSKILDKLQPRTAKYFNEFYICGNCGKIYWKGSHYEDMIRFIQEKIGPGQEK